MINKYTFKQMMGILFPTLLTTVLFYYGIIFSGLVGAIVMMVIGLVIGNVIGVKISDNPFQKMLKGQGILILDVNSTGVVQPYNALIKPPFVYAKIGNKWIRDVFNRKSVFNLKIPIKPKQALKIEKDAKGNQVITFPKLSEKDYMENRMALVSFPVMLYNSAIGSFVSKDFLSEKETKTFAEHHILYINRQVEEMDRKFDFFARHVVEQLKPKSKVGMQIAIFVILGILALVFFAFLPDIMAFMQSAGGAVGTAAGGNAITPR